MKEATRITTPEGQYPEGDGWYTLNVNQCRWYQNEKFGYTMDLEGEQKFPQLGVNIHILMPGKPNCHYHAESDQEDFLVLSGECLLLIEGEERKLKAWDFVHCPANAYHVFVGAGTGPCMVLMLGARSKDGTIHYPTIPLAQKYNACPPQDTHDPKESYANIPKSQILSLQAKNTLSKSLPNIS